MKKLDILGVEIDEISKSDLISSIRSHLQKKEKCLIFTVNNEFIVEAQSNDHFRQTLNKSTFSIADSSGVVWAAKRLYGKNIERIPGADLFIDLVEISKEGYGIFLLGGQKDVGKKAKEELEKNFPGVNIVGYLDGIEISENQDDELIAKINDAKPDIVCVALGAPKQEIWIENNYKKLSANVFIGIGGTLDYTSGKIKRAPAIFRKLSLEWLYRLMRQPSRYPRIKKALIDFPALVRNKGKALD